MQQRTVGYRGIKNGRDWFVVTDEELGVAGVGADVDGVATVEDAVAPGRGSVLLTAGGRESCTTSIIMLSN